MKKQSRKFRQVCHWAKFMWGLSPQKTMWLFVRHLHLLALPLTMLQRIWACLVSVQTSRTPGSARSARVPSHTRVFQRSCRLDVALTARIQTDGTAGVVLARTRGCSTAGVLIVGSRFTARQPSTSNVHETLLQPGGSELVNWTLGDTIAQM